ncbi:hypothetical protein SLEP1_g47604 [Rubroshorea leprosula]|uniref:Uncharacterized protein n=1 Tax=Rubroshorea leprosula TaxID=152421 RepID=A0AAV5LR47_9ROSI|nr:hypothetical protein SLEP1_g47604 [Rubroshorea leprosula]
MYIGSQLLWVSPSNRSYRRPFLVLQLSILGAGYAGEGSTSYVYRNELKKRRGKATENTSRSNSSSDSASNSSSDSASNSSPTTCCGTKPGCTCYHPDNRLVGCIAPAATARESCVCLFLGQQYNWRPHVCPTMREGAREGLRTCCYPELCCTEKENSGNSSVNDREQNTVKNGPQDTEEDMDSESIPLQQENARKMRNRIRRKLFAAKLPGTILGTVLAAVFSIEVFIKISTAVTVISYNLFFWMGAKCYDLGEMENDITDEKDEKKIDGKCGKQDKKDEEKIDGKCGKQIPDALVPEVKKAVKVVLELLLLWVTFASTCYLVNATADSFFMEQVDYLENNTESLKIPKSVFFSFPDIVSNITGEVSSLLVERFHDEEGRWARLLRISIGMLFSSLCCIVASLVAHRLDSNYNSASMLWLLPQFLLLGMMRGILEAGLEEFLHDLLHEHIDNDLAVEAVSGMAELVGSLISTILTAASPSSWVPSGNDISKSHLDNYYRMLAIITLFSTFLFTIVAIAYELRAKEDTVRSGKKG